MTPPVKSITIILGDQLVEPFRPDVEIEWFATAGVVTVRSGGSVVERYSATRRDFDAAVGSAFMRGYRRLVSLSRVVDDTGIETPLEKDGGS